MLKNNNLIHNSFTCANENYTLDVCASLAPHGELSSCDDVKVSLFMHLWIFLEMRVPALSLTLGRLFSTTALMLFKDFPQHSSETRSRRLPGRQLQEAFRSHRLKLKSGCC